jgi:hypothetical protein
MSKLLFVTAILFVVNLTARAADYDLNETLARARIVLKLEEQTGKPVYLNDKKVTAIYEATRNKPIWYLGSSLENAFDGAKAGANAALGKAR